MALTKVIGDGLGGTNDLAVDTDTLKVDATNDKVGINTATPSDYYSDDLVVTAVDEGGITIVNSTTHRGYLNFADGTSGDARYRGYISYDHNTDDLYLGSGGSGHIHVGSTGTVLMPNQPAFHVANSSNQLNLANHTVFTFDTEIFDQNSDFASNTFTAPITGKYQLQLHGRFDQIDDAANWVRVELVTSNRAYQSTIIDPGVFSYGPNYWSFNFAVLADMDASDTAYLQWGQSGGSASADKDTQIHFTGYLVC